MLTFLRYSPQSEYILNLPASAGNSFRKCYRVGVGVCEIFGIFLGVFIDGEPEPLKNRIDMIWGSKRED